MAQKRMIDKKISVSEQVANMPIEAQLIFTWMIPHADDFGLLPSSPRTLKALVCPMLDITAEDVGIHLETMMENKLISVFEYQGKKYYRVNNFSQHQILKKDRQPQTILEIKLEEDHKKNWENIALLFLEDKEFQMEYTGIQTVPELKGSEVKRTEENINTGNSPEIKKSLNSVGAILQDKYKFSPPKSNAITTQWQDKAFRYADKLQIKLTEELKGRWLKAFKQAENGRKTSNLEKAYSYLVDYPNQLNSEEKIKYFFYIYENGLQENFDFKKLKT
ncbi:MAG: hypothetical protein ACR2LN_02505 [Candidatus Levyibacteriota bacterium]